MLPLKDDAPRITTPYITYFLLASNILVFIFELTLQSSGQLNTFLMQFGIVPAKIQIMLTQGGAVPHALVSPFGARYLSWADVLVPIVTSMFLHGGWWHVISNMWALWIFGDNVEDHLGHGLYLLFYLASGIAGALVHIVFNFNSVLPTLGASGAIAGIMGAYFVLFPSARVLTLVPFLFVFFLWLPAWIFVGYWFLVQFLSGAATMIAANTANSGGVAVWAHVGGFLAGIALIKMLPSRPRRYRYYGL
jgi:membrane associated rhomboid family serine protease